MAVKVLELHHHGIRVGPSTEDLSKALAFYRDVLGLTTDPGRPEIPGIPGYWMDLGQTQIHLMGASGPSRYAKGERQDPTLTHVAWRCRTRRRPSANWTGSASNTGRWPA